MAVYNLGPKPGASLGTALGTGLQNLAQMKLTDLQGQYNKLQSANALREMGFPSGIANLPERLQPVALKQHFANMNAATAAANGVGSADSIYNDLVDYRDALIDAHKSGSSYLFGDPEKAALFKNKRDALMKDKRFKGTGIVLPELNSGAAGINELEKIIGSLGGQGGQRQSINQNDNPVAGAQPSAGNQGQQQQQNQGALANLLNNIPGKGAARNILGMAAENIAPLLGLAGSKLAGGGVLASDIAQSPLAFLENKISGERTPETEAARLADTKKLYQPSPFSDPVEVMPEDEERLAKAGHKVAEVPKSAGLRPSDILPSTRNIKKIIGSALPKDYLEANPGIESDIRNLINKAANFHVFGGASLAKSLAAATSGSVLKKGAEKAGFGPVAQSVVEIAGGLLPSGAQAYYNSRDSFKKTASDLYNKFYDTSGKTRLKFDEDIKKTAEQAYIWASKNSTRGTEAMQKQVGQLIQELEGGSAPVKAIMERAQAISALANEKELGGTGIGLLSKLSDSLRKLVKDSSVKNVNDLKLADQITTGLKGSESLIEKIYTNLKAKGLKSTMLRNMLPRVGVAGLAAPLVGTAPVSKIAVAGTLANQGYSIYKFFKNVPGASKLYWDMWKSALKNDSKGLAANIGALDKKASKYEDQFKKISKR